MSECVSSRVYDYQFMNPDLEQKVNNKLFWIDFQVLYVGTDPVTCGNSQFQEFSGWINWS